MDNNPVPGRKDDADKARWDLLPYEQVEQVVAVLTRGAKKYAAENWKLVKDPQNRYFAAAMRHLTAWRNGKKKDAETGLSHLAHACCDLLFNMWFDDEAEASAKTPTGVSEVNCGCGGEMTPVLDIIKGDSDGVTIEYLCGKCFNTIKIRKSYGILHLGSDGDQNYYKGPL